MRTKQESVIFDMSVFNTDFYLPHETVFKAVDNQEIRLYNTHGLTWEDYGDDIPNFAKNWYTGKGFYLDSGTFYQALKPLRIGTTRIKVDCLVRLGLRGNKVFEWMCVVNHNGVTYRLYSTTTSTEQIPRYYINEAKHMDWRRRYEA